MISIVNIPDTEKLGNFWLLKLPVGRITKGIINRIHLSSELFAIYHLLYSVQM